MTWARIAHFFGACQRKLKNLFPCTQILNIKCHLFHKLFFLLTYNQNSGVTALEKCGTGTKDSRTESHKKICVHVH